MTSGIDEPARPTPGRPFLSVVVPVFRNEDTLRELHTRLCGVLEARGATFELILVDDASPDRASEILAELAGVHAGTAVITMERNVGQQWAVLAGLRHGRGEWTAIMDADLQDRPESLAVLLDAIDEGVDVVCAGRRGVFQSLPRMVTSKAFKWLLHVVTGLPADAGIFMVMRRRVVGDVLQLRTGRPHVLCMVGCTGSRAISVPVERERRAGGVSAYSTRARLGAGVRALRCVFECKRSGAGRTAGEHLGAGVPVT